MEIATSTIDTPKIKVAVLYRVIQHWRVPMFERLNALEGVEIKLFYGCDFPGTKVVSARGDFKFEKQEMNSLPIRFGTSNGVAVAPLSLSLFAKLKEYRPDVILCEGASNLPNNTIAYLYAKIHSAKLIQWGLGEIKNHKPSLPRRMLNSLITSMERAADACLAYSSRGVDYYERIGVPREKIFRAVNVVDTSAKLQSIESLDKASIYEASHSESDFVVLFVGALSREKKVDLLLHAFKNFQDRTAVRAKLVIVGGGDDRERLENIAEQEHIANVDFIGPVIEGVSNYFLAADVFVMPGLGGLAVSDSLVHGVPVIASIGDGCEKDLLEFGGGILDEQLSKQSLSEILLKLAGDPELLKSMKKNARLTIDERYNVDTYIDNIAKCIRFAAAA